MKFKETKKLVSVIFMTTIVAVVTLVGTTLYGINALSSERRVSYENNVAASQRVSEMVKGVYPALVGIYAESSDGIGFGSGFLYKVEGETAYIMTNAHVAVAEKAPVVYYADKSKAPAKLLGKDENRDVAVITVEKKTLPKNYKTVNFGDSDSLNLAEPIVAIGNPLDPEYFGTTTTGVVSGKSRLLRLETQKEKRGYYQEFIQIDAAINHGNSGGPLFNLAGQIVGMNARGIDAIDDSPVSNFGFSIPSTTLKALVGDLERGEEVGIAVFGATPTDSVELSKKRITSEVERIDGMKIRYVDEGSVAAKAGFKENDIITKIDDQVVHSSRDVMRIIGIKKKDAKSKVRFTRDGKEETAVVTFSEVVL